MHSTRVFNSADFVTPSDGEPIRSVISQSADAVVVAWHVKPGQRVAAHSHPHGQDTWTILSGCGQYQLDANGATHVIVAGDVVIAPAGAVHGVFNSGQQALIFIAVVSPAEAGFQLL